MAKKEPNEGKTGTQALGELVMRTRLEKGLSRYTVARAAGIKEPTVRGIEIGIALAGSDERRWPAPTEDTLDRIAAALDLDPDELRSVAGKHLTPNPRSDTVKPIISKSIDASGLSDDEFEQIQNLVNTIRSNKGTTL